VEKVDAPEDQEAEYNYQQQAYTTDDSGDTVSRSDDEQNEYQINEPADQTEVVGVQQRIDEVQQDDMIEPAVHRTGFDDQHQVYDNDDDNDDYEEAVRYQRHESQIVQEPAESVDTYQDQSHCTSEQSCLPDQQQYGALEDNFQDNRYNETEHDCREQQYDAPENHYADQDRQEVGEPEGLTSYESQKAADVCQDDVKQHFSEAGLVQHYDEPAEYDDTALNHDTHEGHRFCSEQNETGFVQHYDEPAEYDDTSAAYGTHEGHQFHGEQSTSETEYVDRLEMHDEDEPQIACHNQQYIDENQPQLADEHKQVKFLIENDNERNLLNDDGRSTWQDREQEQQSSGAALRHDAESDNDDEQNQNDEHPVAERGRIKVLLAQWRQIEQQMSLSSGTTSRRDSHVRSRSCGPTTRRNVVANIYENKCNDDIATEFNSNGRRSRWPEEEEEEENYSANRAAILAKFENLEAQAHKTSVLTKKKVKYWHKL
jgi:hypothetical protein